MILTGYATGEANIHSWTRNGMAWPDVPVPHIQAGKTQDDSQRRQDREHDEQRQREKPPARDDAVPRIIPIRTTNAKAKSRSGERIEEIGRMSRGK